MDTGRPDVLKWAGGDERRMRFLALELSVNRFAGSAHGVGESQNGMVLNLNS